jgi:hypothetical protein
MPKKTSASNAQQEQEKLLQEALKRPGVAAAVEAYSRVSAYAPTQGQANVKTGYATGGNAG